MHHLIDPLGVFLQLWEILRTEGFFLGNVFYFDTDKDGLFYDNRNLRDELGRAPAIHIAIKIVQLLPEGVEWAVLIRNHNFGDLVIKKNNEGFLNIPFIYIAQKKEKLWIEEVGSVENYIEFKDNGLKTWPINIFPDFALVNFYYLSNDDPFYVVYKGHWTRIFNCCCNSKVKLNFYKFSEMIN